jgi:hypothetical protein
MEGVAFVGGMNLVVGVEGFGIGIETAVAA